MSVSDTFMLVCAFIAAPIGAYWCGRLDGRHIQNEHDKRNVRALLDEVEEEIEEEMRRFHERST